MPPHIGTYILYGLFLPRYILSFGSVACRPFYIWQLYHGRANPLHVAQRHAGAGAAVTTLRGAGPPDRGSEDLLRKSSSSLKYRFMKIDDRGAGGYRLPLLPLRDIIVFPHMVVPLFVGRDKSLSALEEAMAGDKQLLLAAQRRAKTDDPNEEDIFSIGTVGHIIQMLRFPQ